jgi:hypothetical protein
VQLATQRMTRKKSENSDDANELGRVVAVEGTDVEGTE